MLPVNSTLADELAARRQLARQIDAASPEEREQILARLRELGLGDPRPRATDHPWRDALAAVNQLPTTPPTITLPAIKP